MINSVFSIFLAAIVLSCLRGNAWRVTAWVAISFFAFAQVGQKTALAVLLLLALQTVILFLFKKWPQAKFKLFPLLYAATLITLNSVLKWNIPGFSYIVLSSSLDIWHSQNLKDRAFNLFSFPKIMVGPITSALDHKAPPPEQTIIYKVALLGVFKAFILLNLWRMVFAGPAWQSLTTPVDYLWFGIWNYVNLYLEFSGACDVIAATFWLFGFGCPQNFDRPYLSLSITDFWKRWHITLGLWIKNFVFIPLGGSRVSPALVFVNLMAAMVISGVWHGLTLNYLLWGALQGALLCIERMIGFEKRIQQASKTQRAIYWLITQFLVTISWIIFFGKF